MYNTAVVHKEVARKVSHKNMISKRAGSTKCDDRHSGRLRKCHDVRRRQQAIDQRAFRGRVNQHYDTAMLAGMERANLVSTEQQC